MISDAYSNSSIRGGGRSLIFKYIRKAPISRSDISKNAGICKSSVTALTNQMISQGVLTEIGAVDTGVGRRPVLLDIVAEYSYAIGVSIDKSCFVCVSDLKCNVINSTEVDITIPSDTASQKIIEKIEEILSLSKISHKKCIGIGISISDDLQELGNKIKAELKLYFKLPTRVDDPTSLLCSYQTSLYDSTALLISLGEDISSAICTNGNILGGGKIGHFSIDCNGLVCNCGSRGCLNCYISDIALKNNGYSNSIDNVDTAKYIADKLCYALISVTNLLSIKKIIICGKSENNGEILIDRVKKSLQNKLDAQIELIWLELSKDTVRNSVCASIINEYFAKQ